MERTYKVLVVTMWLINLKSAAKEVNGTMVEFTNKLLPKLLILYTIGNKFSLKKFLRFYKFISQTGQEKQIIYTINTC
ncbi:hypothetical protein AFK68_25585 [Hydrocoleum sp. CS-953]|nr:hypothetical protein AFK68_25585 [Hydrocoleum sp. CS-953]